jgi:hypothetical protein
MIIPQSFEGKFEGWLRRSHDLIYARLVFPLSIVAFSREFSEYVFIHQKYVLRSSWRALGKVLLQGGSETFGKL